MIELPQLFTSRWANKELGDLACVPVGISRGTPRFETGYPYRMLRSLAPNDEAWREQDTERFERAYRRQLDGIGPEAVVGMLAGIGARTGGWPLVLLCYERADQFCHRHVLRGWLQEHGIEISELQPGNLLKRPDAPQPALFD